MFKYAGVCGSR